MNVKVKIRRFNPEKDRRPYWSEFKVQAQPMDRVLDVLQNIKENQDGTLTYRRSCAHGVCGSDAMVINGRNHLACKMLIRDVGAKVVIEPLRGFAVIKDLVVDMEPFWRQYKSIQPFMINDDDPPYTERLQSPEARARFDDTTKCILCAACTSSCPSYWADGSYVGPMAIVQAHRWIFDDRDQGAQVRLAILAEPNGVWKCRTIYNCTEACPRDIQVTKAIREVTRAIVTGEVD